MRDEATPARVLVVDDHALNLKLLQHVLEYEGHEVVAADSVAAAERALAQGKPALIVLDLQLPDGDGLELARRLKSRPETESCAIVACTAGAMKGDREKALAAGCDAYASKPIDTRDFARLVGTLLREGPTRPTWMSPGSPGNLGAGGPGNLGAGGPGNLGAGGPGNLRGNPGFGSM